MVTENIGLYRKERPPMKHKQVKLGIAGSKPRHFSHICVQSDMLENRQNLRD